MSTKAITEQVRLYKRELTNVIRKMYTAEQAAERANRFDQSDQLRKSRRFLEAEQSKLREIELKLPNLGDRIAAATAEIRRARQDLEIQSARLKKLAQSLDAASELLRIVALVSQILT